MSRERSAGGPLAGLRVIEMAGLGPAPFAAMILSDLGAEVVRVDRPSPDGDPIARRRVLNRGRRSVAIDLKHEHGAEVLLALVDGADALLEGFRPGVMERLGVGPDVCLARNPRLIYTRTTGWGQSGPYAQQPGHDINFIAVAGALAHIGRVDDAPTPPLNILGDFGGGGMLAALGVVCGLVERGRSDRGQVVDAAAVDGVALLMAHTFGLVATGRWNDAERGVNTLDTGAHFYEVYECADGNYVSVGAIEHEFYEELLRRVGVTDEPDFADQMDRGRWPALKSRLRQVFRTKTREEWCTLTEGTAACVTPVLTMSEAAAHPHNVNRSTFVEADGISQPAPAPRFARTPGSLGLPPPEPGEHTRKVLIDWGAAPDAVSHWLESGAVDTADAHPRRSK